MTGFKLGVMRRTVGAVAAILATGLSLPGAAAAATKVTWSAFDLSTIVGGTEIVGRPAALPDPGNGQQLVFANTPSDNLVEFAGDGLGTVGIYNISQIAGGQKITGDPIPIVDPQTGHLLVFADDSSHQLTEFDRNPSTGHWTAYHLGGSTEISGNSYPVVDPQTHHLLAVADSPSGDLIQFDRSPNGQWTPYNLTKDVGGTTIVGDPTPIVDPRTDDLLVVARSPAGHLVQWDRVKATFKWHVYDQTHNAGAGIAGDPVPIVDPTDRDLLVFATGGGGHLLLFDRANGDFVWTYRDLTSLTGAAVTGAPSPIIDPTYGSLLTLAGTPSGQLDLFARSGSSWAAYDLTVTAGGPAVDAEPAAFRNPISGNLDVFDSSTGEHLVEIERQLTAVAPPVTVTVPPPPPPEHHRHRRYLSVKVSFRYHYSYARTRIKWLRFGRMSRRAEVRLSCSGRGCPWRSRTDSWRHRRRLERTIAGRSFRAGDRLTITISERGWVTERVGLRFRSGARPRPL